MIWALALIAVLIAGPFIREATKTRVGNTLRDRAPGQFAALSDGVTHYQWHGPETGKVLVCVHGLTTPSYVWDQLVPFLTGAGYRVLTYDLYGRGYSDRVAGKQDQAFFLRQLRDLLAREAVEGEFDLLGYSMGGSIVTGFAAAEPERLRKLILLAPAGMKHTPGKFANWVRQVPLFGDWMMLALGARFLTAGATQSALGEVGAFLATKQRAEAGRRGYLPAVLSSQRNILADTLRAQHEVIHKAGLETHAIWGEVDGVIPLDAKNVLSEWSPDVTRHVITNAGHALAITHPEMVANAILSPT